MDNMVNQSNGKPLVSNKSLEAIRFEGWFRDTCKKLPYLKLKTVTFCPNGPAAPSKKIKKQQKETLYAASNRK
jgi:hypothetical protein